MKKIQLMTRAYAIAIVVLLVSSFAFVTIVAGAGSITLTPSSQAPGGSVSVSGTGYGAIKAVGIGFGAEVAVANEPVTVTGSVLGPFRATMANRPIRPGTFVMNVDVNSGLQNSNVTENGDGVLLSTALSFSSGIIDYATGQLTWYTTVDPAGYTTVRKAFYTSYQYNVTPAANITTNASGSFTANIVVPSVVSGNYNVTAIDSAGNRAASSLSVGASSSGWSKTYGGAKAEGHDNIYPDLIQTSDGGFLLTGDTSSYGAGSNDAYLVKVDANGEMQWNRTYGGPLNESASVVCITRDGGYAIMCITNSYGAGGNDFWLVKTDSAGNMQWNKTYGGTGVDNGYFVFQTADGGYVLYGETNSFGAGGFDVWLIKTDAAGNMLWNKTYGATGNDWASNLILTADGGYAVVSYSTSFGGYKAWFAKLDASGAMAWNKTYSLTAICWACFGIQTADGGYAITGVVYPTSKRDTWLIKTDSSGNMLWNKTYGGTGDDTGWGLVQMDDGGYTIIGVTASFGAGGADSWLFRTDASGNMLWNKTYGGTGTEFTVDIIRTSDGGYAISGFTDSFGAGSTDLWLIKTDASGVIPEGLAIGVIMLLSSIAALAGALYFRKPPRITK